jgi:hypothetical protein
MVPGKTARPTRWCAPPTCARSGGREATPRWSKAGATGGACITATKRIPTLKCQTLLDRILDRRWLVPLLGKDLEPIPKPAKLKNQTHGIALSDDFSKDKFGFSGPSIAG